jgi:hypothetical protein
MEDIPSGLCSSVDGEVWSSGPCWDTGCGNVPESRKVYKENAMPLSAWIMFLAGCVILYGGLALCIGIAVHKRNKQ